MKPDITCTKLFKDVQMNRVFPDGKTFVDCTPLFPESVIIEKYEQIKNDPGFSLTQFVLDNFEKPVPHSSGFTSDTNKTVSENIESLWAVLTRQPDKESGSLIPLPYPYIVPGGRFGEIYYWDSYFTMLGLKASGKTDMLENMVKNFSRLIETFGYIPNGNRRYFIGRSQPPFFSLMVKLLSEVKGDDITIQYLASLQKEYDFWMNGKETLESNSVHSRVIKMPNGEILNRYWDEHDTPRPESYREDVELAEHSDQPAEELFRHLRAGAESGWDFSSRWFREADRFDTIHTTDIIPVDLNCLLLHLEMTLVHAYELANDTESANQYKLLAENRKLAIDRYCWDEEQGFFTDYDWKQQRRKKNLTLAGTVPLFLSVATAIQADLISKTIEDKFLKEGGLISTLITTGQQWDAPNGWAPLHWMTITGLENYGLTELAGKIAERWIRLNTDVFSRTGKMMEKYNVVDTHLEAGGGEYEGQDGFGWTNGVLLALLHKYGGS
ncbi:MAG: alpha,alpha-trehalase TreF [Chitinophagaceae bacterium]|nr:alpha,alpha-trehalase TreF [Chitinophagaceae bacterium]